MNLKDLFSLSKQTLSDNSDTNIENDIISIDETKETEEVRRRTYHEVGYRDGSRNIGGFQALSICLTSIYAKFENEERLLKDKQHQLKQPHINEQKNKETELKALNVTKHNKEEQIDRIDTKINEVNGKIENLKFEINDLPRSPGKYHIDASKGASTKFWIGLIILLPVTLYLFTFYISTSYSAFFKKFNATGSVIEQVLDAQAFSKAWKDGPLEGAFVTLIPFVFLGLGYLIHMFSETKSIINYFKIGLMFLITFIFDAILAYQIETNIYETTKTFQDPPFDLAIAFTKIQFWGIIFAGFVVYIIWGLVFDFVMKEHKERDKIKQEQIRKQKDIKIFEERANKYLLDKEELQNEINNIKESIARVEGRINELQRIIDATIIPTKEYILYASEYVQGWITFISEGLHVPKTQTNTLINDCTSIFNEHLVKVGAKENTETQTLLLNAI